MFCPFCGNDQAENKAAKFCSNCGKSLTGKPTKGNAVRKVKEKSAKVGVALTPFVEKNVAGFRQLINKVNFKKLGLFGGGGVALLALLAIGAYFGIEAYQITMKDDVHLADVIDAQKLDDIAKSSCSGVEQLMLTDSEKLTYESQKTKLDSVSASTNLRAILKYRDANLWTMDTIPDADENFSSQANKALDAELSSNPRIIASSYQVVLKSLIPEFKTFVLDKCGLTSTFASNASFITDYNNSQSTLNDKANSAPWYPNGYFETADGLIAWKWVQIYEDCYSCRYSHVSVIAKEGCYGGLYAETNFLHNGVVIDWTNDSLPSLGAGQKAVLLFKSYNDNADQTEAPTFNCH